MFSAMTSYQGTLGAIIELPLPPLRHPESCVRIQFRGVGVDDVAIAVVMAVVIVVVKGDVVHVLELFS